MEDMPKTRVQLCGSLSRAISTFQHGLLLAGIILVGLLVRLAFMEQEIRYDEAQTFNLYVSQAPDELFHMTHMNNHLFHSLLVWLTTMLAGNEPWAIRLPAFLAGVATIPLTYRLSRSFNGGVGGHFAAAGMAVFPFMVLFSTNARGYTLVTCFVLLLAISILQLLQEPDSVSPFRIALLTSLGIWTNLSMVYPAAGLLAWLFLELYASPLPVKKVSVRFVLPICLLTLMLSLAMHTPTLLMKGGFDDVLHNPVTRSLPGNEFISGISAHVEKTIKHLFRDVSVVFGIGAIVLAGLGVGALTTDRKNAGSTLLLSMIIGTGAMFVMKRSFPFTRNWIFLIPIFLVHADAGFTWLVQRMPPRFQIAPVLLLLIPVSCDAYDLVRNNRISHYNDTGRFPEVLQVTSYLTGVLTDDDIVVAQVPHNEPLDYYLRTQHPDLEILTSPCAGHRNFIVVRDGNSRNRPMTGLRQVFKSGKATVFVTDSSSVNVTSLQVAAD